MRRRLFTLEEANAELPWLIETFAGLMPVRDELAAKQQELIVLLRAHRGNGLTSHETERRELQRAVNRLTQGLQGKLREVGERGIIVRDLSSWLVDFPSLREGREIYLCWIRGEERIDFWHETNAGFDSRQPL